ncbi:MAG: hypothetical protein Q8Q85_00300 [Gemmatimonadales bacterium]|nr:hypothetical protein [Gemmatimonadales bacterium]
MVAQVSPREVILADSGIVVVTPIGLAVVDSAVDDPESDFSFAAGDTLFLLDYLGEGLRRIRVREETLRVSEFWDSTGRHGARLLRPPLQIWWVHVTLDPPGVRGWILMTTDVVAGPENVVLHGEHPCS